MSASQVVDRLAQHHNELVEQQKQKQRRLQFIDRNATISSSSSSSVDCTPFQVQPNEESPLNFPSNCTTAIGPTRTGTTVATTTAGTMRSDDRSVAVVRNNSNDMNFENNGSGDVILNNNTNGGIGSLTSNSNPGSFNPSCNHNSSSSRLENENEQLPQPHNNHQEQQLLQSKQEQQQKLQQQQLFNEEKLNALDLDNDHRIPPPHQRGSFTLDNNDDLSDEDDEDDNNRMNNFSMLRGMRNAEGNNSIRSLPTNLLRAPYLGSIPSNCRYMSPPRITLSNATEATTNEQEMLISIDQDQTQNTTSSTRSMGNYGSLRESHTQGRFLDGPCSYREKKSGSIRPLVHRSGYNSYKESSNMMGYVSTGQLSSTPPLLVPPPTITTTGPAVQNMDSNSAAQTMSIQERIQARKKEQQQRLGKVNNGAAVGTHQKGNRNNNRVQGGDTNKATSSLTAMLKAESEKAEQMEREALKHKSRASRGAMSSSPTSSSSLSSSSSASPRFHLPLLLPPANQRNSQNNLIFKPPTTTTANFTTTSDENNITYQPFHSSNESMLSTSLTGLEILMAAKRSLSERRASGQQGHQEQKQAFQYDPIFNPSSLNGNLLARANSDPIPPHQILNPIPITAAPTHNPSSTNNNNTASYDVDKTNSNFKPGSKSVDASPSFTPSTASRSNNFANAATTTSTTTPTITNITPSPATIPPWQMTTPYSDNLVVLGISTAEQQQEVYQQQQHYHHHNHHNALTQSQLPHSHHMHSHTLSHSHNNNPDTEEAFHMDMD